MSNVVRLAFPRVRLFRAGTYGEGTAGQETWSVHDLDDVVRNFWLLSHGPRAIHRPPVVRGHVEQTADNWHTAVLAAGTVGGLWREGPHLYGSFAEVGPVIRQWMDNGSLRSVSVELYRDLGEAGIPPELARGASGPLLRRVSLLGGWPPRVKGLGNPPWAGTGQAHQPQRRRA